MGESVSLATPCTARLCHGPPTRPLSSLGHPPSSRLPRLGGVAGLWSRSAISTPHAVAAPSTRSTSFLSPISLYKHDKRAALVPPHKLPSRSLCPKARLDAVVTNHIARESTEKPVVTAGFCRPGAQLRRGRRARDRPQMVPPGRTGRREDLGLGRAPAEDLRGPAIG